MILVKDGRVIDPARVKTRKKRLMSWRAARSAGDEEAEERLPAEDRRSRTGSTCRRES